MQALYQLQEPSREAAFALHFPTPPHGSSCSSPDHLDCPPCIGGSVCFQPPFLDKGISGYPPIYPPPRDLQLSFCHLHTTLVQPLQAIPGRPSVVHIVPRIQNHLARELDSQAHECLLWGSHSQSIPLGKLASELMHTGCQCFPVSKCLLIVGYVGGDALLLPLLC